MTNYERQAVSAAFLESIGDRYGLGPEFMSLYLAHRHPEVDVSALSTIEDLHGNQQPARMYVEFALTNILRGRQVRDTVLARIGRQPAQDGARPRYLDVGTAYGGFLVAFHEAGYDPLGIELSPEWAELGRANCRDHDLPHCVIEGDFLEVDLDQLGTFDIITCNDVIEHVLDPVEALRRIAVLLRPGGVAYFQIPNARCINSVERDGHFNLFGIMLLDHYSAASYVRHALGNPTYSCGEYYPLEWYEAFLERFGLTATLDGDVPDTLADVPSMLHKLGNQYAWWYGHDRLNLPPLLASRLAKAYAEYCSQVYADYGETLKSGRSHGFATGYLMSFWSILATKSGASP